MDNLEIVCWLIITLSSLGILVILIDKINWILLIQLPFLLAMGFVSWIIFGLGKFIKDIRYVWRKYHSKL